MATRSRTAEKNQAALESGQVGRCNECKKQYEIPGIMPYYFHRLRKSFWLCQVCVDAVYARYHNAKIG
jgi:hypothetical protein